ncbi:MAG: IS1595 family transposase [Terriglobales bacterium]
MNRKQTIPKHLRYTIHDFQRQFPTDEACLEHLKEQRFPGGITYCEKCQQDRKHYKITGRPVYSCDHCGTQISPMAGTIFEHSSTSLRLWYYAMYLMASTRCGISAKQIQRETGVTYKTAWRMFRQIRTLLSEDVQLEGEAVEMDETGVGPTTKRMGRSPKPKTTVFGMVERKGRVKAVVASDRKKDTLMPIIKEYVFPESVIFTDEFPSYDGLNVRGYDHRRINHSAGVYVMGDVHTNTIEGFWSLVKRGIGGVYHQVSQKYLQSYLDEYSFRYNRRDQGNLIFTSLLKRVAELAAPRVAVDRGMTPATAEPF